MSANLPLDIRPVQADELSTLLALAKDTFITAFAPHNTAADMETYVQAQFNLNYFNTLYQTPGTAFFMAYLGQEPVAYLKLNVDNAQTEQLLDNAIEIERIYVKAAQQGQGFGLELLNFSLEYGRSLNKEWIWLGVWEQNYGAIRFYERHGFRTFSQHDFYLGNDLQLDLLMKRKL